MTKFNPQALSEELSELGKRAVRATEEFLHSRGAIDVYTMVTSHFNNGGELCDGPFVLLAASFIFTSKELDKILPFGDELASIKIKRYDVFDDGRFQGKATVMYSIKKDKAYFFGG